MVVFRVVLTAAIVQVASTGHVEGRPEGSDEPQDPNDALNEELVSALRHCREEGQASSHARLTRLGDLRDRLCSARSGIGSGDDPDQVRGTTRIGRGEWLQPQAGKSRVKRMEVSVPSFGPRHLQQHHGDEAAEEPHNEVAPCALLCAFAQVQLVTPGGLPGESLLAKRLEDSVAAPRRRVAAMRHARACFLRLGAGSAMDDDPCLYTMKLVQCLDMDILREYYKTMATI